MAFPILSSLIVLPIVGAILLLFVQEDEQNEALIRNIALVVSVLVFAETLLLWAASTLRPVTFSSSSVTRGFRRLVSPTQWALTGSVCC